MAQHDYVIANGTGAAVRSDLNNALAAIVSQNSGATAPSPTYAFQWWADTTTGLLKLRNAANSSWITLFQLDGEWSTIALENGTAGAPSIYFKDSGTDTGFYSPGTDQVGISTGGTARLTIDANGNVNIDSNTLYVDAANNRVGLGTSSVNTNHRLEVNGTISTNGDAAVAGTGLCFGNYSTGGYKWIQSFNSQPLCLNPSGNNVGIGATTVSDLLHLRAATTPHLRIDHTTTSSFGAVQFYEDTTQQAAIGALGSTSSGTGGGNALQIWNFLNAPTVFATNNQERARITSDGKFLVGTSSTSKAGTVFLQGNSASSTADGTLVIAVGSSSPANGATLGTIYFSDSGHAAATQIYSQRDGGTWTSGTSQPTRLVFSTTADGASSPTERARITQNGFFKASSIGAYADASAAQHELTSGVTSNAILFAYASNGSYAGTGVRVRASRSGSSSYYLFNGESSDGGDNEFILRGDGNAFADGTWSGGGADYAEYFEWSDGNPDEEDRRGISVVLDNNQIRPAVDGEDPIGVISGNPSVVGDAAWNKWSGKYLRDDYGTYIQEDYEIVNDEGETVVQQRRKLNPAYDPDQEYVSREQRPEWDCVGLMGKLRIRKGQPTGSRWIKMRDISDSVEEWLVR
jgi:hypothetical protein